MTTERNPKGPWINRFATRFFTVVLAVLIFWLLGFIVRDIKTIRGPDRTIIERKHVDQALVEKVKSLDAQIAEVSRRMGNKQEEQRVVGDSSRNLQQTIGQLVELQKLSIEKAVSLPESEQNNLSTSLSHFLKSQKQYQDLNADVSALMAEKRGLEEDKRNVQAEILRQQRPAHEEYDRLYKAHKLKLAAFQLSILIPLLAAGAFLVIKKRDSIYFPLFLASGGATLLKVALVIHEYFPKKYFKYILIVVLLLAVGRMLIHFIKVVAFPKAQWLAKQYREAYERFLCPVCEYPIRIGPRRFLFWTRRTVNKFVLPGERNTEEESYTCPSCGTPIFEQCPSCQKVRHSLLAHCRHCGVEKSLS